MAENIVFDNVENLALVVTHPAEPNSGDPVRMGTTLTGVALIDEQEDGITTVKIGAHVADLSVKGVNDGGNSAVALYDRLYYVDGDTPNISKKESGVLFGIALETVGSGLTATIRVLHISTPVPATESALSIDGAAVDTVANANVIGGVPLIFRIDVADAATGDVDVVMTHKIRVIDAWIVKTAANAAAANTITVKNGANAITNAIDGNVNDTVLVRAGSIDDAQHEIAAAGTLRITRTKAGGNAAYIVYVEALRVA